MIRTLSLPLSRALSTTSRLVVPESLVKLSILEKPEDHQKASEWLSKFQKNHIPKKSWVASFSRSSGPGGQHVNTTNSKATISFDLSQFNINDSDKVDNEWLPKFILKPLKNSNHFSKSSNRILISSQISRSSIDNLEYALDILYLDILNAGKSVIVGQTSGEQKRKVKELIKRDDGRRRIEKEKRGSKKASRRDWG